MRLFAHILNPDGSRVGDGPLVTLRSASVTRALDGAGSVQIDVPGTDRRAVELLRNKRRTVVYTQGFDGQLREIGRGIIDDIDRGDTAAGWTMNASGPDILGELKYSNTLFKRSYNQKTISEITSGLIDIMIEWGWTGWSATGNGTTNLISARFDAATVLKALQQVVSQQGLHLRLGATGKSVEVGAFGTDAGLRIIAPKQAPPEIYENDDVALIERIKTKSASEDLITWLLPLAGGQNVDSALSLQYSNRTSPYTIQQMTGPDGRTLYFIKKQTAIDLYGTIPKVGTFKEISPLSNSDADIRNASNATYDAAVATLDRYSEPQEAYTLTVRKCTKTIRPGDKVHIQYQGDVEDEEGVFRYRDIDADFWVMKATERLGLEGGTLDLEVSNADRYHQDVAQVIIGSLESLSVSGVSVQPNFCLSPYGPYQEDIDSTHPVSIPLRVRDSIFELNRALLQIKTRPFRVNAKTTGAHNHIFAFSPTPKPSTVGWTEEVIGFQDQFSSVTRYIAMKMDSVPSYGNSIYQTVFDNPPIDYQLNYGINDDTDYPDHVAITVDGVTVASGLDPSGTGLEFEIDIAPQLQTNLRSTHTIGITCTGGQGHVEVSFELYPNITPFKLAL